MMFKRFFKKRIEAEAQKFIAEQERKEKREVRAREEQARIDKEYNKIEAAYPLGKKVKYLGVDFVCCGNSREGEYTSLTSDGFGHRFVPTAVRIMRRYGEFLEHEEKVQVHYSELWKLQ